jgi:dual specificity tyrosine-phosphorylation-regulated kinase 2/3/4
MKIIENNKDYFD